MSINMYVGEVRQQVQSINSSCQSTVATMEQIQQALSAIIIEPGLKGATYDSMKNYFNTVYMPVTKGFILVCERMIEANQQFLNRYLDQVDVNSLQESVLEERIRQYNRLSEMLDSIVDPVGFNARMIDGLQEMRQQTIRKLDSLREYDYFSIQIFDELESQLATLEVGITILSEGKAWNQTTGTFSTMGLNLDWASSINESWESKEKRKQEKLKKAEEAVINNLKKHGLTKNDLVQVDDTEEVVYQKYLQFVQLGLHPHTGLPLTDSEKVQFNYAAHAGTISNLIGVVGGAYAANKAFNANTSKKSKTTTSKKAGGVDDRFKKTPEIEKHLKYTDPSVPRKRGIGGAHNSEEFFKNDVKVIKQTSTDVPGVSVVEYQIPELDAKGFPTGNYKKTIFRKSIYDPKIIPDDEYIKRGLEAANDAGKNSNGNMPREWVGKDSSGKTWRGFFKDGKIDTFFPD